MASITESIDVEVPVRTAYDQWTQFEEFPRFMEGVQSVEQIDDAHLRWVAERRRQAARLDGRDHRAATRRARRVEGDRWPRQRRRRHLPPPRRGRDPRHRADGARDRGAVEQLGSALGVDSRRVQGDLERFKDLDREPRVETGAWRGEVEGGERIR